MSMKKKIEKAIDMALANAEFNEYYINDFEKYANELYDKSRNHYQFYAERGLEEGKKEIMIWVSKNSESKYSYSMSINDYFENKSETFDKKQILADEELSATFLQYLLNTLDKYHFKYEDIVSGKALSVNHEGSIVGQHIESYLIKLADMLSKGINSMAHTKLTCWKEGNLPMVVNFSQFAGKASFEFIFENHLLPGGTESKSVTPQQALASIKPNDIEHHQVDSELSESAKYILRGLMKIGLAEIICDYTSGLNEKATFEDVVRVIQFRTDYLNISENKIKQMNEQLGDHGVVILPETNQAKISL